MNGMTGRGSAGATREATLTLVLKKADFWERYGHHSLNDRQRLILNRLLNGFEGRLNSSKWAKLCNCSQDTALRDIGDLLQRGILKKEPAGGRSTSYLLVDDAGSEKAMED